MHFGAFSSLPGVSEGCQCNRGNQFAGRMCVWGGGGEGVVGAIDNTHARYLAHECFKGYFY